MTGRKAPKRITEIYLRRVLGWYLERYDAPEAHVRRLMMRRVRRSVRHHELDLEECTEMLEAALEEFVAAGLIDDRRFAENLARTGRARGWSTRRLQQAMREKGVGSELSREVMEEQQEDLEHDPDLVAAVRYARRRRFGPWRREDAREDAYRRELASLARAGFSFGIARQVLDAEAAEVFEELLPPTGW